MTHVFIGRMVHYRLSMADCVAVDRRREDARNIIAARDDPQGFQAHVGSTVSVGEIVAMVITEVWAPEPGVNGQAFLDGNDSLWVTSVNEGDQPGEWTPITDG